MRLAQPKNRYWRVAQDCGEDNGEVQVSKAAENAVGPPKMAELEHESAG